MNKIHVSKNPDIILSEAQKHIFCENGVSKSGNEQVISNEQLYEKMEEMIDSMKLKCKWKDIHNY
jgi:hypothetical protein